MIKPKSHRTGNIEIDLTGPQGNAFCLMGHARNFGKQLGWSKEEITALTDKMMSGDYENLVKVFDEAFGDFVTLLK